jgi:ABC-2 type transport system permease protein
MAWVFVRLKWRLLANAGASGREEALGWLARAVGMIVAATGAVDLATAPRHGGAGLVAVFVAVGVGWIMLPLLAGSDRTLDATRLAALPLTRRELVVGLFAASLVGAPPLGTLVLLSGAIPAYSTGGAGTAIVVADVVVIAVLSIATEGRSRPDWRRRCTPAGAATWHRWCSRSSRRRGTSRGGSRPRSRGRSTGCGPRA